MGYPTIVVSVQMINRAIPTNPSTSFSPNRFATSFQKAYSLAVAGDEGRTSKNEIMNSVTPIAILNPIGTRRAAMQNHLIKLMVKIAYGFDKKNRILIQNQNAVYF
jgi:hypothetical protein